LVACWLAAANIEEKGSIAMGTQGAHSNHVTLVVQVTLVVNYNIITWKPLSQHDTVTDSPRNHAHCLGWVSN
jgi:hypothetical protein